MISEVIIKESKLKIQRETCTQISISVYEISTILSGGCLNKGCFCPTILTEPFSLDHELFSVLMCSMTLVMGIHTNIHAVFKLKLKSDVAPQIFLCFRKEKIGKIIKDKSSLSSSEKNNLNLFPVSMRKCFQALLINFVLMQQSTLWGKNVALVT